MKIARTISISELRPCSRYKEQLKILKRHGILGMKWSVRRTPEELGRHVHYRQSKMPMEEYVLACEYWKERPELQKLPDPKNKILSSFTNDLTAEEKESSIVRNEYNNHMYVTINKGNEQYKIIDCKRIPGVYDGWLDEVLSEVVGDDWRKYDD